MGLEAVPWATSAPCETLRLAPGLNLTTVPGSMVKVTPAFTVISVVTKCTSLFDQTVLAEIFEPSWITAWEIPVKYSEKKKRIRKTPKDLKELYDIV